MTAAARCINVLLLVLCLFLGGQSRDANLLRQDNSEASRSTSGCEIPFPSSCKDQVCMVFLEEEPWVLIPEKGKRDRKVFEERQPFPCKRYREYGLDGMLFETFGDFWRRREGLSENADDYQCMFAGNDCTWNGMFNLVASDGISELTKGQGPFQLVFFDALLETDKRRRSSSNASVSLFDDRLVIVGSKGTKNVSYLRALKEPFDKYSWFMVLGTWLLMLIAGLLLKPSDPSKGRARSRQREDWATFLKTSFDALSEAVAAMLSVEVYIAEKANNSEKRRVRVRSVSQKKVRPVMSLHHLIRVLYTMAVALFFVIFILLFEAAFINFLFEERLPELERPIRQLSQEDLSEYVVQANSAVGDVFHRIQSKRQETATPQAQIWVHCLGYHECLRELTEGRRRFTVMEEVIARFLIKDYGCDELTIFTSVDSLFDFNTVMYYSPSLDVKVSEALDVYLLNLKLNRRNTRVEEKYLGNTKCPADNGQITFEKILVPLGAVFVAVLLALSAQFVLIILFWWRGRNVENKSVDVIEVELFEP